MKLAVLPGTFAVARCEAGSNPPGWAAEGAFWSLTRTARELSVVCEERLIPQGVQAEHGWACLAVAGPIDFSEIGVLAALSGTLAEARVSLFALSTYDTDHLLVRREDLGRAIAALEEAGHQVA